MDDTREVWVLVEDETELFHNMVKSNILPDVVMHTLIPELRRQRQVDLCKTGANLVYTVSSWAAWGIYKGPVYFF